MDAGSLESHKTIGIQASLPLGSGYQVSQLHLEVPQCLQAVLVVDATGLMN